MYLVLNRRKDYYFTPLNLLVSLSHYGITVWSSNTIITGGKSVSFITNSRIHWWRLLSLQTMLESIADGARLGAERRADDAGRPAATRVNLEQRRWPEEAPEPRRAPQPSNRQQAEWPAEQDRPRVCAPRWCVWPPGTLLGPTAVEGPLSAASNGGYMLRRGSGGTSSSWTMRYSCWTGVRGFSGTVS